MAPPLDPERMHVASPLAVARDNLEFELDEVLAEMERHARVEVRAVAIQRICAIQRQIGMCDLLTDAGVRSLHDHLARSGQAYLDLLGRTRWDDLAERYDLCASRAFPFLDALAAGDLARARAIAAKAAPERSPEDEDEEDYGYAKVVMALASSDGAPDPALLDAYRAASEPDLPRPRIVEALVARDADAFGDALRALVALRKEEVDAERENPSADPVFLLTEAHVFVEGIALARLAALRGIPPAGRIALVPRPAWKREPTTFPAEGAWRRAD